MEGTKSVTYLRGCRGRAEPNFFFRFHAVFGGKLAINYVGASPSGVGASISEILDLPLHI